MTAAAKSKGLLSSPRFWGRVALAVDDTISNGKGMALLTVGVVSRLMVTALALWNAADPAFDAEADWGSAAALADLLGQVSSLAFVAAGMITFRFLVRRYRRAVVLGLAGPEGAVRATPGRIARETALDMVDVRRTLASLEADGVVESELDDLGRLGYRVVDQSGGGGVQ